MDELFICGDPRFASGGDSRHVPEQRARALYESLDEKLPTVANAVTSEEVRRSLEECAYPTVESALEGMGQLVHAGKGGYHDNPGYNVFTEAERWPAAGVELETIARCPNADFADHLKKRLHSNWFHFERDGSLDSAHDGRFGFELITEPLPPRLYRDLRFWTGLENLISPWLVSYGMEDTGLHVHVSLEKFTDRNLVAVPFDSADMRCAIGAMACAFVYFRVADQEIVDRTFLRAGTYYCERSVPVGFPTLTRDGISSAELVDTVFAAANRHATGESIGSDSPKILEYKYAKTPLNLSAHTSEVNLSHKATVEFRRGKGTTKAMSVHRMVEFATSVVRYVAAKFTDPSSRITAGDFMGFVRDTTTSNALRNIIAEKYPTKGNGTKCAFVRVP